MILRAGHLSTLYHTSIMMMARPGLLAGFQAHIEWRLFGTGPEIVRAFEAGGLDMAYIGLPPAVIGISRGLPLRCIAGGHIEGTVIASHAGAVGYPEEEDPGAILSPMRAIGVPGRGSIHDLILMDLLDRHGLSVEVRNLPWADEVLEAFARGEVDAVVGTPALAEAVRRFTGGKIIYPPHLLWPDNPSYGIVVREDLIEKDRGLLGDFLVIHEGASEVLRTRRQEASAEIAGLIGVVDEGFVRETLGISPRYCASLSEGYMRCAMRLARRLRELGYTEREVREDEVFDPSIIREVHPGPPHYR
jgi:NitT/TauT family transport system substrate-binding protein